MLVTMDYYQRLSNIMWDDRRWWPPGLNWTSLKSTESVKYPHFNEMYLPIFYSIIVQLLRIGFEWSIARPLGRAIGIVDTGSELPNFFKRLYRMIFHPPPMVHSPTKRREKSCTNGVRTPNGVHKQLNEKITNGSNSYVANDKPLLVNGTVVKEPVKNGSPVSDRDQPQVAKKKPTRSVHMKIVPKLVPKSTLDKFCECAWRAFFYASIWVFAMFVLWDKSWLWDAANCWIGYPFHSLSDGIWWIYMIEASFYWALTFSQFVDVQRKDFTMNFVHHLATILLLWFSWAINLVRVGSLVVVVHDCADFWLETAKMARYGGKNDLGSFLFGIFSLVWIFTRCGVFPLVILYSTFVEAPALIVFFDAYYWFNFLLLVLQILHILWTIMIIRMIVVTLTKGEAHDARSDDESEYEEQFVEEMVQDSTDDEEELWTPKMPSPSVPAACSSAST